MAFGARRLPVDGFRPEVVDSGRLRVSSCRSYDGASSRLLALHLAGPVFRAPNLPPGTMLAVLPGTLAPA